MTERTQQLVELVDELIRIARENECAAHFGRSYACEDLDAARDAVVVELTRLTEEKAVLAATVETMREALELFIGQAVFDPHTQRASVDEFVVSKARAALFSQVGQSTGQGVGRG